MNGAAMKRPVVVVTTSLTLFASSLGLSSTAPVYETGSYINNPTAYIRHLSDWDASATNTSVTMAYERVQEPRSDMKFAAFELFGQMRSSTPNELALYESMKVRLGKSLNVNIFAP